MLSFLFNIEKNAIITFIASVLIWLMFFGVIYLWIYRKKIHFRQVVAVSFAVIFAWSISELIKILFPTQRPFEVSGAIPLTLTWPLDSSFPSAHTSTAFALAVGLRKSDKRLFFLYILFAFVVGAGRMLSKVHYFVDVFAGALIGISAVVLLEKLGMEKMLKKILA